MKQLARTAVYWPNIDTDIVDLCHKCSTCAQYQNMPSKATVHPWMLPEKPWSRLHVDHAVNFMGYNWLVVVDAYTKYPCIHTTQSVSSKSTMELLDVDFAHFGYPHTIVTDNATTFKSEEFQEFCKQRGIVHLTGAPYHPATNGAAERLVQTLKQFLRKSSKPPKSALQDFLMQYRRTPLSIGYSPSELLNNRQMRTKIDTLLPSPAHLAQGKQAKETTKSQSKETDVLKVNYFYKVGDPCYACYFGSWKKPRWVPATIVKRHGSRCFNVKVFPNGPVWRRHIEQLRPRYSTPEDEDPGDDPATLFPKRNATAKESHSSTDTDNDVKPQTDVGPSTSTMKDEAPVDLPEYGPHNPRRSGRMRKPPRRFCCD